MDPEVIGRISALIVIISAIPYFIRTYQGNIYPNLTSKIEIICAVVCILSFATWLSVKNDQSLAQYSLYLAIVADLCASVPTIIFVWTQPHGDRPVTWTLFAIGYGLAVFAITEHTFANYILPLFMFAGGLSVALPLALYRWRIKARWIDWV